jgi:hypothetical protein
MAITYLVCPIVAGPTASGLVLGSSSNRCRALYQGKLANFRAREKKQNKATCSHVKLTTRGAQKIYLFEFPAKTFNCNNFSAGNSKIIGVGGFGGKFKTPEIKIDRVKKNQSCIN